MALEVHDLTAAYALDALDAHERDEYERHLATCERCRAELAQLQDASAQLAFGAAAPAPPAALRDRVLERVRADGGVVVPFRRRRITYALGAVAAAAAVVAIGLGVWASSLADELDAQRSVVGILADPDARTIMLDGANGRVVVNETGDAALVVAGLGEAPSGKTYEIWVIEGATPRPAGLFDGSASRDVVRLTRPVPPRATVAVTVEPEGGVDAPTTDPIFSAST